MHKIGFWKVLKESWFYLFIKTALIIFIKLCSEIAFMVKKIVYTASLKNRISNLINKDMIKLLFYF